MLFRKTLFVLLSTVFGFLLFQTGTFAAVEDEKSKNFQLKNVNSIPKSDKGVTVILRAPTLEAPRLVKVSTINGKRTEEVIPGFQVSLFQNTPVFFRVDCVNTVLYNVAISVNEKPQGGKVKEVFSGPLELLKVFRAYFPSLKGTGIPNSAQPLTEPPLDSLLVDLEKRAEAIDKLNSKLDALLYRTETPQFYSSDTVNGAFESIPTEAAAAAKELLGVSTGTSPEVHVYIEKIRKDLGNLTLTLKNAQTLNVKIDAAAKTVLTKLRAIEKAVWFKEDTQERILKEELRYTCTITSRDKKNEVQTITHVVTVKGIQNGWFTITTQGPFISRLIDDPYVLIPPTMDAMNGNTVDAMNGNTAMSTTTTSMSTTTTSKNQIKEGAGDSVALSSGLLVHILHSRLRLLDVFLGPTMGLGVDGNKNPQVVAGGSLLFNPIPEMFFGLTIGTILGKKDVLDGYEPNDLFKGSTVPIKKVYRNAWFAAITFNFDSLFGGKTESTSSKD